MKPIPPPILALLIALLAAGVFTGCGRKTTTHFGEPFSDVPTVTIADLLERPADFYRKPIRVSGTIERQCPASGCWFFLRDEAGRSIRVELGDTFPTLPQFVGGTAEVEGEWVPRGGYHEFIGTRVSFTRGEKESP